ncbi:hypothetical protein SDC9_107370 [bioreactor metagenome]|uniref:Hom-end-associated Hint domain-containing protein n=1 Tax=bioreactor metagenome TaxID=1076179 RepID=A0A645B510_9ZZZZ|nr:Hint domain-containing homing endonuclease [Candidatus Pelethousia sp.]
MGFAKDTRVTMADGSWRYIEHIAIGDRIMGDGKILVVTNILLGRDATLLQIQVKSASPIKLSPNSVVMTSTGVKQACEVGCGDALQCEDGRFAIVQEVEAIKHDDIVYHLGFDQKGLHFANGIAVGSFEMVQEFRVLRSDTEQPPAKRLPDGLA